MVPIIAKVQVVLLPSFFGWSVMAFLSDKTYDTDNPKIPPNVWMKQEPPISTALNYMVPID